MDIKTTPVSVEIPTSEELKTPSSPKNKKRFLVGVIVFLGLLFVTVILLAFYKQSQKQSASSTSKVVPAFQDEIANWKTYRNEKYGFQFKYPADHTPFDTFDSASQKLNLASVTSDVVTVAENESHLFCCEPLTLSVSGLEPAGEAFSSTYATHMTIDDYPAVQFNGEGNLGSLMYKKVIIDKDGVIITVTQAGRSNFLSEIFSTFKFIETTVDTSDWHMYRNEKYGFEFRYPRGWIIAQGITGLDTAVEVYNQEYSRTGGYRALPADFMNMEIVLRSRADNISSYVDGFIKENNFFAENGEDPGLTPHFINLNSLKKSVIKGGTVYSYKGGVGKEGYIVFLNNYTLDIRVYNYSDPLLQVFLNTIVGF
ncbi:MAG: hypothetical protein A2836_02465 [Candidatus Taylorbacteria bacterium RIFCSPHIGHO2_01_FULL_45_63]|uniref:Uncharacterized protein n=1 Tax=Candidatus Taylorbacteria bacterium RIFCSPHIGHO2_02_FULL_45_35 TaxID=1802311 RepID=A0A1G2MRQ5_9BACT|nr:MAG: hypothetical protein A2836_02465 [Candidatus Taylorbacteria bacterium RIFCSPHIGHO2_01_FULL_45_63]OHA26580.1 MAG: hypothetical protein A3D56_03060 [Candidatus Taylorbacteria bacterium RIFCSPHIGHO2_02_FULL_45_35]OHA33275.1 MAG: hypothetical protein A3A22_01685 [Candidatus Taylorbacteria bacterium RIFCSPLOWO2_01_FULL_45_34b]